MIHCKNNLIVWKYLIMCICLFIHIWYMYLYIYVQLFKEQQLTILLIINLTYYGDWDLNQNLHHILGFYMIFYTKYNIFFKRRKSCCSFIPSNSDIYGTNPYKVLLQEEDDIVYSVLFWGTSILISFLNY